VVENLDQGEPIMTEQHTLIQQLTDRQWLTEPVELNNILSSPWYIKLLMAFAGWLSALFFFGFFGITVLDFADNAGAKIIIGVTLLVSAYFVLGAKQSEFLEHVGLAISLTGQGLLCWAVIDYLSYNDAQLWLYLGLAQLVLAWYMPSFLHRIFSAFIAAYAFSMFMSMLARIEVFSSALMLACAWLWLSEFQHKQYVVRCRAIAYGFTIALLLIKTSYSFNWLWLYPSDRQPTSAFMPWLDEGLNCLILLYVSWQLVNRYQLALSSATAIAAFCSVLLVGLASIYTSGLALALMFVVLGFASSHRILMGLGVTATLTYLSKYYYSLELTLSEKSLSLFGLGLLLLALAKVFWLWFQPREGKV
jgi:hypothetical protein